MFSKVCWERYQKRTVDLDLRHTLVVLCQKRPKAGSQICFPEFAEFFDVLANEGFYGDDPHSGLDINGLRIWLAACNLDSGTMSIDR